MPVDMRIQKVKDLNEKILLDSQKMALYAQDTAPAIGAAQKLREKP